MGFLRKIGKKIKKKVKKLFSSKLGSLIGSIGISMIMGPIISKAFNGIKGVFTGATQAGTAGTVNVASNTVTGAMEKLADTSDLFVDFGSKGSVALKGEASVAALKEKIVSTVATGPTVGQQIKQNFVNLGTGVKEFASDPFGKTKEYIGEEFVPDAVKSIALTGIQSAFTPEYEEPFQSKGVQNVGSFEPAQSSYMREVQSQIPNLQATDFNQLSNNLFYGTLSPQYLAAQAREMGLASQIPVK